MFYRRYIKITDFLDRQHGHLTDWMCQRVLMCLHHNQVYVEQDSRGDVVVFCGWWVIDQADLDMVAGKRGIPVDITKGDMIWIMDGACVSPGGMARAQRHLKERYPVSSGIKGVACLRNDERLVVNMRWHGVDDISGGLA